MEGPGAAHCTARVCCDHVTLHCGLSLILPSAPSDEVSLIFSISDFQHLHLNLNVWFTFPHISSRVNSSTFVGVGLVHWALNEGSESSRGSRLLKGPSAIQDVALQHLIFKVCGCVSASNRSPMNVNYSESSKSPPLRRRVTPRIKSAQRRQK